MRASTFWLRLLWAGCLLLLLLLTGQPVLAQARPQLTTVQTQSTPELSTAQLWQALREHPAADRRRVDLLNELADDEAHRIEGIYDMMRWTQRDSLLRAAFALAHQLHYAQGEVYAQFLNPVNLLAKRKLATAEQIQQFIVQEFLPWTEHSGNKALLSRVLIEVVFRDVRAPSSLPYVQRAVALAQAAHVPRLLCHAYRAQGYYYREIGDYYQGLQGFFRQLRAAQQAGLADEVIDALDSIGDLYTHIGDNQQALQYYQQSLPYVAKVAPASYRVLMQQQALTELGYGYQRAGNYSQALTALQRAVRLEPTNYRETVQAKIYIAQIFEQLHDARTLTYTRHLFQQARSQRLVISYRGILQTLCRYYLHAGLAESAVANGQKAVSFIRDFGDREDETDVVGLLAQAYALRGQYAQAYTYQHRYQGLHDTLRNEQMTRRVTAQRFSQDMARQRSQITQLTRRQQLQATAARRQRAWLLVALAGLVLLGGGASLLWRLYRQKQRANALLATQKAQIEEQAARLGELDEAKNQFFANVSHELRTPLTLVLGPLDALLTGPAAALPAASRAPVALAHRQAQRLLELVNRILDLTKLQAGRLALQPVPTPLAALLRRVVAQFGSLATQRGIVLAGPGPLAENLCVLLDASKVEEILTNLLINALNHTPAGGTVSVALTRPAGPASPDYALTVRDTGPGIAEAEQARVFERFYQSPQRQARGGTGLGLALSRELAQLLGGALTLVSAPGHGAAFTLRFPAPEVPTPPPLADANAPIAASQPAALATAELAPTPPLAGKRPRVLVVEDQPDLREYVRTLLAPSYEVLLAEDGQAALELLAREAPIDLLTTDAMMPRLSGTELLARLKAEPAYQQLPVLMLTARADEAHRLAAFTTGVDDYLTKPFTTSELLARVRALLARHQVRRHFATLPPDEPAQVPKPLGDSPALASPLVLAVASPAATSSPVRRKAAPLAAAAQLAAWQAQVAKHLGDEKFGPTELAGLLCLSERTLYRRLGELTGLTPATWLRELRLDQARRLLEAGTHRSVAEVADTVGFVSPKYFAALYTERFGRRPADYSAPN